MLQCVWKIIWKPIFWRKRVAQFYICQYDKTIPMILSQYSVLHTKYGECIHTCLATNFSFYLLAVCHNKILENVAMSSNQFEHGIATNILDDQCCESGGSRHHIAEPEQ